jgi:phage tail sheath gpL-like
MPISFANIPQNIKVPLYWVEVDPSMAGLPSINLKALLVGVKIGSGVAAPNVPIPIGSQNQADENFGAGSELSRMSQAYYSNNFANELWALPVSEPVGASAATGTITITAAPTAAGTIHLYVAGTHVPVNVMTTDTVTTIATAIAGAINNNYVQLGDPALPVTATSAAGVVTLTSLFKSVNANDIYVSMNYYGSIGSEFTPPGLGITLPAGAAGTTASGTGTGTGTSLNVTVVSSGTIKIGATVTGTGVPASTTITAQTSGTTGGVGVYTTSQATTASAAALTFNNPGGPAGFLSGGTGTPDFSLGIAAINKQAFEYVAMPYTDSNSLFAWDQEYGFTDQGRWGWMREQFGHVFSAKRGSYASLIAFGDTQNSGVESIMAFEQTCPSPMFEVAAAYAAKAQRALINDPARPLQTLSLNNIKAAPLVDRFDFQELNSLASNGLAIQEVGSDNQPMILREQNTYQLNLYGQSDDAYELVTTLATLAKLLRNQKQAITSKFPRHKLADDGTKFGPGQAIVTPGIIKAELVNEYQIDEWNGLVENLKQFKAHLLVERDSNDPNRVNVLYPPDLINQLRIFAVLAQFRLQYDRGIDVQIIGQSPPPFQASSGAPT